MSVGLEIQIICVIMTWLNNLVLPATDENVLNGTQGEKVENVRNNIVSGLYGYTRNEEAQDPKGLNRI